ncbi:MAG: hypothetical protein ABEH86_10805 [Haloarcula sp.]
MAQGSTLTTADSDGDGLADGTGVHTHGTDPTVADTDGDGVLNGEELEIGTSPVQSDSDGDGAADGRELKLGTARTARSRPRGSLVYSSGSSSASA